MDIEKDASRAPQFQNSKCEGQGPKLGKFRDHITIGEIHMSSQWHMTVKVTSLHMCVYTNLENIYENRTFSIF